MSTADQAGSWLTLDHQAIGFEFAEPATKGLGGGAVGETAHANSKNGSTCNRGALDGHWAPAQRPDEITTEPLCSLPSGMLARQTCKLNTVGRTRSARGAMLDWFSKAYPANVWPRRVRLDRHQARMAGRFFTSSRIDFSELRVCIQSDLGW